MARPTQALINITALRHNYSIAQQLSGEGRFITIVKANAYGHGAVLIAEALADRAEAFGVSCIEEAVELRTAGITQPILLLEGAFSADEVLTASEQNFWLLSGNRQQIDDIIRAPLKQPLTVWLKVDTGMHRLGLQPEEVVECFDLLKESSMVSDDIVVATHFSSADELSNTVTKDQIESLLALTKDLDVPLSMANSPALIAWPEARREWNRPGLMLYGNSPFGQDVAIELVSKLQPVMTLSSAVISLRDVAVGESVGYGGCWTATKPSRIATVAIGYGDGYPRHAISGTPVWINGQRVGLVGRVSMDMISIDVSELADVAIGDNVELWGAHVTANEVASHAGTIGYEILTRMPMRTPRYAVEQ